MLAIRVTRPSTKPISAIVLLVKLQLLTQYSFFAVSNFKELSLGEISIFFLYWLSVMVFFVVGRLDQDRRTPFTPFQFFAMCKYSEVRSVRISPKSQELIVETQEGVLINQCLAFFLDSLIHDVAKRILYAGILVKVRLTFIYFIALFAFGIHHHQLNYETGADFAKFFMTVQVVLLALVIYDALIKVLATDLLILLLFCIFVAFVIFFPLSSCQTCVKIFIILWMILCIVIALFMLGFTPNLLLKKISPLFGCYVLVLHFCYLLTRFLFLLARPMLSLILNRFTVLN